LSNKACLTGDRCVAQVDVSAIKRNCAALRSVIGPATRLCAVVKGDAYGHGCAHTAGAAVEAGADWLAVATASEAAELRSFGVSVPVLTLGALSPQEARAAVEAESDVVCWTQEGVRVLSEIASSLAKPARVHVKLDTGMGRLGEADASKAYEIAKSCHGSKDLVLRGVMTHFATADESGDEHFSKQLEAFRDFSNRIKELNPDVICHAANSAATLRDPTSHFDLVRCGIAVYGLDPFQRDPYPAGLEPALSLESYVASVKRLEPGQTVGYGRHWGAREPTWVGVLPIGYGDGWRRGLSNNAEVLVNGKRCPVIGLVSMDHLTIDLGPDTDVTVGDRAVLIGSQGTDRILCEEVATRLETINYEVTCGLTKRVRRVVVRS
jgi:alanine racemase